MNYPQYHEVNWANGDRVQGSVQYRPGFVMPGLPASPYIWSDSAENQALLYAGTSQVAPFQVQSDVAFPNLTAPVSSQNYELLPLELSPSRTINGPVQSEPSSNPSIIDTVRSHRPTSDPVRAPEEPRNDNLQHSSSASLDWERYRSTIKRLHIDEDKTLEDTRKILANEFNFHASIKFLNEKKKEWGLTKYLTRHNAEWMAMKGQKRRNQENKETQFILADRVFTLDRVQRTVKRLKNNEHEAVPEDAPTPFGITYDTPLNEMPSPNNVISPRVSRTQLERWTPVPTVQGPSSHSPSLSRLRLIWSGRTRADIAKIHREAHELDSSGNFEAAEGKFRTALDGFQHILGTTHHETKNVAYQLISFYAKYDRMSNANAIIDWMCDKHIEKWGIDHKNTMDHVMHIIDMLRSWSRTEDAITFAYQILDASERSNNNAAPATRRRRQTLSVTTGKRRSRIVETINAFDLTDKPGSIDNQIDIAVAHVETRDEVGESLVLGLIAQCKQHPQKLAVQLLRTRSVLARLYLTEGKKDKLEGVLEQAETEATLQLALDSGPKKSETLLDTAIELAELFVKAERHQTAEAMFLQIVPVAVDTFGEDSNETVRFLIRIGMIYQQAQKWTAAQPYFEQALAASITYSGLECDRTQRLEAALENERYEMEILTSENVESTLRKRWCR